MNDVKRPDSLEKSWRGKIRLQNRLKFAESGGLFLGDETDIAVASMRQGEV
jgi:hypothetical protein